MMLSQKVPQITVFKVIICILAYRFFSDVFFLPKVFWILCISCIWTLSQRQILIVSVSLRGQDNKRQTWEYKCQVDLVLVIVSRFQVVSSAIASGFALLLCNCSHFTCCVKI